jgi:predicted nucleotidyltransferase
MTDALPLPRANPVLVKFSVALAEMYGPRLERVVLYGSRARGEAEADSDYDVAVFLKDLTSRIAESNRIALAVSDILSETGMVIHAMPFPAGSYRERTMLMHEIRREGLDL